METNGPKETEPWMKESRDNGSTNLAPVRFRKGGIWGRRTTLEKALILFCALILVVLIVVIIVLVAQPFSQENSKPNICITQECVSAAARIDKSIDYSVKPCDNLYQFACGRWMKENVIPQDKSVHNTFEILRDQVSIVLKNLLEDKHLATDLPSMTKARDFYQSCMNMDLINKRGGQPLTEVILDYFGGWPLTDPAWDESSFNLVDTVVKMNRYGAFVLLSVITGINYKNSTKYVLQMDQTSFGMPNMKYYLVPRNDTMLMAYENMIYSVVKYLGPANPETAREEVKDMVDFEIQLAKISVPDEERRDSHKLYNPMTLNEVHENYSTPLFDWKDYVIRVTSHPEIGVTDVGDDEIIINHAPQYFKAVTELIGRTPKRTIANLMIWRLVFGMLGLLGDNYEVLFREYKEALVGTSTDEARFRKCVRYTTRYLGLAVGRLFVKDNFDVQAKTMALEMIDRLQKAFNELLNDIAWMDEPTKIVAKEKNEHIIPKIGYPEQLLNDTFLEEYYTNYTYHPEQYFENVLGVRRESYHSAMRKLRETVDKTSWVEAPSTVNAFYDSIRNRIMFPAGILQPPFFSKSYPKSLNYGGIGDFIGHEITHGFDDSGRQYDKSGNLVQWWSQSVIDKFKTEAQCIVDQYGNFTVPSIDTNINGVNTQGENIADNGGLKQSFKAYRNWVDEQGHEEASLPGLNFTHNQLFFINFAQMWCNLMRDGEALRRIRTGAHSPSRFRVIGSAQNSEDFARVFNCPPKSYMNPTEKCSVW